MRKILVLVLAVLVTLIFTGFSWSSAPIKRITQSSVCEGSPLTVRVSHTAVLSAGFAYAVGERIRGAEVVSNTADYHEHNVVGDHRDWFLKFLFIPSDTPEGFNYRLRVTAKAGSSVTISGIYRDMSERREGLSLSTVTTRIPVIKC
ncbi:MAG: hypothetical protein HYU04_01470 [Candidatus Wildermuthbacteria bacterium]|nr:hypothetical protein [Candidatus Wildermuthbacteria bacterium]